MKHGIRAETWLQILKTEEVLEKDCGCQEQKKRGRDLSNHQRLPDSTAPSIANRTAACQTKHVLRPRSQDGAHRRHGQERGRSDGNECNESEHLSVNAHFGQAGN